MGGSGRRDRWQGRRTFTGSLTTHVGASLLSAWGLQAHGCVCGVRQREPREIWRGVRRVSGSRCMQQGWAAGAQQARAVSWAGREAYRCARCEGLGRFESSADALNRLVQIQVSADLSKSPSVPGRRRSVRARPAAHGTARACSAPAAQPCCMHLLPIARRAPGQLPWAPFAARTHAPLLPAGMQSKPMHLEGMLLRAPSATP